MKEIGSGFVANLNTIANITIKVVVLIVVVVLAWRNYGDLERNFKRMLSESQEVSVGIFHIKFEPIEVVLPLAGQSGSTRSSIEQWAVSDRVRGPLVVTRIAFDDHDGTRSEYLEVEAQEWVDLGGGYVGDSDEVVQLAAAEIKLAPKECLRIHTYVHQGDRPEGGCARAIDARRLDGREPVPFLKYHAGKGDRLIILQRDGKPVLDLDYWSLGFSES